MEPERWKKIEYIFHEAMACDAAQRAAVLERSCGEDRLLREEVESLLNYGQRTAPELDKPALELVAEALATDLKVRPLRPDKMIGARIGAYKIVSRLGEGGMGDVYRAVRADDEYQRHVALKLLRDLLRDQDASFFLGQFRSERQILANLQHPNIARLFDGGTTEDGVPYFVMELVEGRTIDQYCDQHRLTINGRLNLFLQIASAVQYAHQRLIVHRDIKPANIYVTSEGLPVLLDFGIAKIIDPGISLDAKTATLTGMRMMTPEYACPEQVRGETITTASDVYSLGVVLYELLAGRRPYRFGTHNPLEIARVICDEEPRRPSTVVTQGQAESKAGKTGTAAEQVSAARATEPSRLARQLRGDLDAILLKALRKEPEKRYATAGELGDDIRRFLEGRPVQAQRGTGVYRARKFLVRHRAVVALSAVLFVSGVVGIVSIVRAERQARRQQLRAEQRFDDVRTLANSLLFEIHDSIRDLPGSTAARKLLVSRALKYLDSLAKESGGDAGLQRELAAAYERVGDVQGNPLYANLGDTAGAIESYRKALQIRQVLAAGGASEADQAALTQVDTTLGNTLIFTGDFQSALQAFREANAISENLATEQKSNLELQDNYAGVCFSLGRLFAETGDLPRAGEYFRKSAAVRESITGGSPIFQTGVKTRLAGAYGYLSGVESQQGDLEQAIALQTKAGDILASLLASDPNNATLKEFSLQSEYWVGYYLAKKGSLAEALAHYAVALGGYQKLVADDPKDALATRYLGQVYVSQGVTLARQGKAATGLRPALRGNQIMQNLADGPASGSLYKLVDVAHSRAAVGDVYEYLAQSSKPAKAARASWQNARNWYVKSLEAWTSAKEKGPLGQSDQLEPEKITQEIAKCDAALARSLGKHSQL